MTLLTACNNEPVDPITVEKIYPYWNIPLDYETQEYLSEVCSEYDLDEKLVIAVIKVESDFKPFADNGVSKGLMQVVPYWHKDRMKRLGVTDLEDACQNILIGCDILSEKVKKYGEYYGLVAYNGGDYLARQLEAANEIWEYSEKVLKEKERLVRE